MTPSREPYAKTIKELTYAHNRVSKMTMDPHIDSGTVVELQRAQAMISDVVRIIRKVQP